MIALNLLYFFLTLPQVWTTLLSKTSGRGDNTLMFLMEQDAPRLTPNGDVIVEGDIVIPKEFFNFIDGRKAAIEEELRWPEGVVPFAFHSSVSDSDQQVMLRAMQHWENETCIRFRERAANDYLWIRFRTDGDGCWSLVGRQSLRYGIGQDISIGLGCAQTHVVVHEIGHAVGFFHEQSRSDRDSFIKVIWANVQQGYETQFRKEEDNNFNVPYDFTSIMQYPAWAFSKNVLEKNSIVTKDPRHQRFLGRNGDGLSFRDKKIANSMYSCNKGCPNANPNPCQNEGYLRPYAGDGQPCKCECPPTAIGSNCENKISDDYYEATAPLTCGGNMTGEGIIQTPYYPNRNTPKVDCVWNIRSLEGSRIQLDFEGFEIAPRNVKPGSKTDGKCLDEAVEIRLDGPDEGKIYCGTDIEPGMRMTSTVPNVIIILLADAKKRGTGLRARVSFIDVVARSTVAATAVPVGPTVVYTAAPATAAPPTQQPPTQVVQVPYVWRRVFISPWRQVVWRPMWIVWGR